MLKNLRFPVIFLLLIVSSFCMWNFIFLDNAWMKATGSVGLQLIGGTVSFIWLTRAFWGSKSKYRGFWLLLGSGVLCYLTANVIWMYVLIVDKAMGYTNTSYSLWLLSYTFYLAALICKIREIQAAAKKNYVFNIVVFMITAAAISTHYLIEPALILSDSLLVTITNVAYPVISLSILFVLTILYYLVQYSREKDSLLFILLGFGFQVGADSIFVYLSMTGSYQAGNFIDLLWLLAILMIGFGGLLDKESNGDKNWKVKNLFENRETLFPYISTMILLVFVIYSYDWNFNTLSLGLLFILFIILGRQILIMNKNSKLMAEYRYLAYHDPLTGLCNRARFKEDLEDLIALAPASGRVALLLIDLDRFKVVNDTLGHHIGDQLLVKTAERLKYSLVQDTKIYRLGGDEFLILLADATEEKASIVAKNILDRFQKPFFIGKNEMIVTPSIGISIYPDNGANSEELFRYADAAMYLAKESGKNSFRFYNTELNKALVRKMEIERGLRNGIRRDQFTLYYQPKIHLQTRQIIGMEALLRWEHPKLGRVSPAEFIPIAEEIGQIIPIGQWVLQRACKQNRAWQEQGFPSLCVSVNVSVQQFQHSDFIKMVRDTLNETGLDPQLLELEITESIMQNIGKSKAILYSLREMGVKTSLDDFGTGYSSLNVLQNLPIDTIKIDKSFIDEIGKNNQKSMVKTIIDLGINLNLNIVAEGIEHEYQMDELIKNHCYIGQGYYFSMAVHPKEFEQYLQSEDSLNKRSKSEFVTMG